MKTDLVGENGLAAAGRSLHDVDTRHEQSTTENAVESGNTSPQSLRRRVQFGHLGPLRSTVGGVAVVVPRKHDGKTCPLAQLTLDGDGAAHRHADVLDHPQADAKAATAPFDAALEPLED